MRVDIITLFPGMFRGIFQESMIGRAVASGKVTINIHNLRTYTSDRHRTVDDIPFGGGPGMVIKPEPVFEALKDIKGRRKAKVILVSPQGRPYHQKCALALAKEKALVIICGHYEGFDERIRRGLKPMEISMGDYVLTGGEIPAMTIVDSVVRLLPGVVGDPESIENESFMNSRLDFPQYTRPRVYKKMNVPDVLLSGNHKEIKVWRLREALKNTLKRRPDLLNKEKLGKSVRPIFEEVLKEVKSHGQHK
ncbi:tRNA (guanosine(37)-N1)-methyltransferase TrmD [PVC group bacterium]|nr:tRNA (guanosine(37)-N1)-methyltransferase TrmD [PVC group bacterium]